MEYMNKILIGFKNGREIELETDYGPYELYKIADSQGFINQVNVLFNITDVSYIVRIDTEECEVSDSQ